jgi:putative intracellular protease/amidase
MSEEFVCLDPKVSRRKVIQGLTGAGVMFGVTRGVRAAGLEFGRADGVGSSKKKRMVGYLLFEGVDPLDVGGPYEVFGQARLEGKNDDEAALFDNCTIAQKASPVRAENGMRYVPEYSFDDHPQVDILMVPGGPGMSAQKGNGAVIEWIRSLSRSTEITAGVCTGAFLLAEAGCWMESVRLLTGRILIRCDGSTRR